MAEVVIRRLARGDEALALETFAVMAAVFADDDAPAADAPPLTPDDAASLLARADFWALAALDADGHAIGGLTAHALPMTRSRSTELFIYDLAVRGDLQRRGIGRALVEALLRLGREAGITVAFVPADDEDTHALAFYEALGGAGAPVTIFTFDADG